MTMHLDAYFSLSDGVKSSSTPIMEKLTILSEYFHEFYKPGKNPDYNYFFFLGDRIMII